VTAGGKPVGGGGARHPNSLANLPNTRGEAPAGAWQPGISPNLGLGDRTRKPHNSPEWSPAVQAAIGDLEQRVGSELRDHEGDLQGWALPSVEAVAIQRVAAWRAERYVADREARGVLTLDDLDRVSKVGERYHRALEREALTLRSRVETVARGRDLASEMAADYEREQAELEAEGG